MRLTLFAAACVVVWLWFYRRVVAEVPLKIPSRWPACVPENGASYRAAPVQRRAFDGARLVIVSTWLPTRCGIATYSAGLRDGLLAMGASVDVVAVHLCSSAEHAYGPEARAECQQRLRVQTGSDKHAAGRLHHASRQVQRLRTCGATPG